MTKEQKEFKGTLSRAFKDQDENVYIRMDGHAARNPYMGESWNFYVDNKYIRVVEVNLEQETFLKGYITKKGRKWIESVE